MLGVLLKQASICRHGKTKTTVELPKHVTSRNSVPRIWEGGKKFFHAVR